MIGTESALFLTRCDSGRRDSVGTDLGAHYLLGDDFSHPADLHQFPYDDTTTLRKPSRLRSASTPITSTPSTTSIGSTAIC